MINIDPKEVYNKLDDAGQVWVEKNAVACLLEKTEKSELNTLVQDYIKLGSKSNADAESKARADQRTFDHIREMVQARKEAESAKVKYESAKTWFEAMRTQASTMRAELNALPGTK